MRISNGIRKLEDSSIKAINAIKPKASWLLRKTAMTAFSVCVIPVAVVTNMTLAATDTLLLGSAAAVKAIKEV